MDELTWKAWFEQQSRIDQLTIAMDAIERLMELGEVEFRRPGETRTLPTCLYWTATGDDMRIPF